MRSTQPITPKTQQGEGGVEKHRFGFDGCPLSGLLLPSSQSVSQPQPPFHSHSKRW
jgi:hypothetical protein